MAGYDFAAIEKKWQRHWEKNATFRQPNPGEKDFAKRPKIYILDMFIYPSGEGLHVGHGSNYTATDIVARYWRMKGLNVLHPTGYDAFGLPAEQYAVEHGVHPRETTAKNIANIERQFKMLGFTYDPSRRLATTDPQYYRWTQWIFLQMFNSWFDPVARAARPIAELIRKLESGDHIVDFTGQATVNKFDGMSGVFGAPAGMIKWYELTACEQREVIDSQRLAYMAEVPVNWCPQLGTVLANEEVTNEGKSDRGNFPVYRRALKQWMLRITAYADRLLEDLEDLDWPEPIKIMQRNWIGKSTGANVDFPLASGDTDDWFARRAKGAFPGVEEDDVIRVYTTRPDTLFGATYMVLAPEHPLVHKITTDEHRDQVRAYVAAAAKKSELERAAETKQKTGVFTGAHAVNPINRRPIPIWVADYVMMGYGTGAIMAVPGHDTRDLQFADQFALEIIQVVEPPQGADWRGYVGDGVAVNCGKYDGLTTTEFKEKITADLGKAALGEQAVNYKLRDWLFSRQRYWGEPFPIVHCEVCGMVPVPQSDLPLLLPEMDDFTPQTSQDPNALPCPPLAKATDWVETTCPTCGAPATRELNTMPQWAGSCWYYLRFTDAANDKRFCDEKFERYWMAPSSTNPSGGVDLYVGGAEHAVLHLLYSRFWHKVLYDLGYVSTAEPFGRLRNQGMIRSFAYRDRRGVCVGYADVDLSGDKPRHKTTGEQLTETVEKMSKSLKNVVNPDEVIGQFGADTFRLYEMFMGPLEASKPWNTRDVPGVYRFLQRIWRMIVGDEDVSTLLVETDGDEQVERALHKLIKKVSADIEVMKFNTSIAAMMEFVNTVFKAGKITQSQAQRFVLVLAPFAPHIAEELWAHLGHKETLAYEPFPAFDESLIADESVELAVQVNGKVRARITVGAETDEAACIEAAKADPKVVAAIGGKHIVKEFVVTGRLVNLVVK